MTSLDPQWTLRVLPSSLARSSVFPIAELRRGLLPPFCQLVRVNKYHKEIYEFYSYSDLVHAPLVAGSIAMTLAVAAASTSSRRHGKLHVTKDCSEYTGQAGSFCTITSSNVPAIAVGAKVFYFQALIASTGVLDSNVVLDAGGGNRAVGRCTLDLGTNLALCTLSDGTGELSGFHARVDGSGTYQAPWDGTYNFIKQSDERDDD